MKNNTEKFKQEITKILNKISLTEERKIIKAAKLIADSYYNKGQLYLFGTGHNHCLAEEALHRAGGFAGACPILDDKIDFSYGISKASKYERSKNVAISILKKYKLQKNDILLIFSNSGVNTAPLEAANFARSIGIKVISITSLKYSKSISLAKSKKKLFEISDLYIDNKSPIGDSIMTLKKSINFKIGTSSSIAGLFILNAIFLELANLLSKEKLYPFYLSSNLKGSKIHNKKLESKFKVKNKFLK